MGKKINAYGKIIPTTHVSTSSQPLRVFFFDDNLELDGLEGSSGICSLRDVKSGKFVDFAAGKNGFELGHAGRHTAVLHSSEYNSVLVKANILDAIEDPKVLLATTLDERKVMQVAVNYELWDKRDVEKFERQFCEAP